MADIAIVACILIGALLGFRKGFIVPVVATGGALLTGSMVYAGPLNGSLPAGAAGLGAGAVAMGFVAMLFARVGFTAVGLVHRFSLLRSLDRVLGLPLGAATAAVALYVALLGTLALDGWLDPLHGKTALGTQELATIQALARAQPALAMFVDPATLDVLLRSASVEPVSLDEIAEVNSALGFYEKMLRPALLQSKLAPLLLAAGEELPLIGAHSTPRMQ